MEIKVLGQTGVGLKIVNWVETIRGFQMELQLDLDFRALIIASRNLKSGPQFAEVCIDLSELLCVQLLLFLPDLSSHCLRPL